MPEAQGKPEGSGHDECSHALFPASSIVLSSAEAGWRDIRVERLHLSFETEPHHHDEHFLTLPLGSPALIEEKEGRRHRQMRILPGEFTLIGANIGHQVRYEDADVLAISLAPTLIPVELLPQQGTSDPQVERIGQLLKAELEAGCPTGPLFADALGQALAAHLTHRYSAGEVSLLQEGRADAPLSPMRLRRALDYLEANLERDVSLSELAEVAGLSAYHFARQFKAATGMAPHNYLISRRVEQAKAMLSRTDMSIAAIASATGFSHQSHLTRHFKRLVGTTPALFR
jgi:AraC family transcriptional regulator